MTRRQYQWLARALCAASCLSAAGAAAADSAAGQPRPLGRLAPFWRYSAGLGPFHEIGHGLTVVPDYLSRGDFPYRKRPYPMEALFADHLSLVRLLGGFSDGADKGAPDPSVRERDLAWRDAQGAIHYRFELLAPRIKPYLDNGYTSLTIVLDNVPWCFPEAPAAIGLGQHRPPRDSREWGDFIRALCGEFVEIMGREAAGRLRFRVGTENGGRQRFDGSHEDYIRHYDHTAAAIRSVLPEAEVGIYNISGVSLKGVRDLHNVRPLEVAAHCRREPNLADGIMPTPFAWVAYSRYFRPGEEPAFHADTCREVWDEFARAVPELGDFSREIHEFGVAPWGEAARGVFPSSEPGALGAAMTAQVMLRLREAGIDRLWHWGMLDAFRDRRNELRDLPTGRVWLFSILEAMAGGDAWLADPVSSSAAGTRHLAAISIRDDGALILVSAYHPAIGNHAQESVRFRLPAALRLAGRAARCVRLDRDSALHDRLRRDLAAADLLAPDFQQRPDNLGGVREMGAGRPAESLVGDRLEEYLKIWEQSMTLGPLDPAVAAFEPDGTLRVRLAPPMLLAIQLR